MKSSTTATVSVAHQDREGEGPGDREVGVGPEPDEAGIVLDVAHECRAAGSQYLAGQPAPGVELGGLGQPPEVRVPLRLGVCQIPDDVTSSPSVLNACPSG